MAKKLKQYEIVLKAIEFTEKCCPYPEDVFTPLTADEMNEAIKAMAKTSISFDRLSAHMMRTMWVNAHKLMRINIRDEFEK